MEIEAEAEDHPVFGGLAVDLGRQIGKQIITGLAFSGIRV